MGELLLSLNYLPSAGRLNCDVIKAKQLLQTDMDSGAGACNVIMLLVCHIQLESFHWHYGADVSDLNTIPLTSPSMTCRLGNDRLLG